MKKISLNGSWNGVCVGRFDFKAQIPGCTIADLIANGRLPKDLLVGKNADAAVAYEDCDWIYAKTFVLGTLSDRTALRFERIDTYADIYLNGKFIAHTENGNVGHTFDVSKFLVTGKNILEVRLFSPIKAVENLPKRSGAFTTERLYTRRKQCTYGWDWEARFVACGIGETELVCYDSDETIVKSAYIFTESVQSGKAFVKIETEFENSVQGLVEIEILSDSGERVYKEKVSVSGNACAVCACIENAKLWYPVGYGKQPLYILRIKDDGSIFHEETFGIRTVEIIETPDEKGSESYQKCL
jgi:beta-mannosidase